MPTTGEKLKPFMFVLLCTPSKNNRFYSSIAKAKAHVWVIDNTLEAAKNEAIRFITGYKWEIKGFEHAFEIETQQLANLQESERLLYEKALLYGVSAEFLASPIKERDETDPILHLPLDIFQ